MYEAQSKRLSENKNSELNSDKDVSKKDVSIRFDNEDKSIQCIVDALLDCSEVKCTKDGTFFITKIVPFVYTELNYDGDLQILFGFGEFGGDYGDYTASKMKIDLSIAVPLYYEYNGEEDDKDSIDAIVFSIMTKFANLINNEVLSEAQDLYDDWVDWEGHFENERRHPYNY